MSTVRCRILGLAVLWGAGCAIGCAPPSRSFRFSQWGELRAVLHDGKTESKVRLGAVCELPSVVGVGAVEGLAGEILVLDGTPYVTSVGLDGKPFTRSGAKAHVGAAMLVVADVPSWGTGTVVAPIAEDDFDRFIRDYATRMGVDVSKPFPFVIKGTISALEGHVINGACPLAGGADEARRPYGVHLAPGTQVTLVGIYAENAAGVITHHDSKTHVHVLTGGGNMMVAHVDRFGLEAGAKLRLPLDK